MWSQDFAVSAEISLRVGSAARASLSNSSLQYFRNLGQGKGRVRFGTDSMVWAGKGGRGGGEGERGGQWAGWQVWAGAHRGTLSGGSVLPFCCAARTLVRSQASAVSLMLSSDRKDSVLVLQPRRDDAILPSFLMYSDSQ